MRACIGCGGIAFQASAAHESQQMEGMTFTAAIPGQKCASCGWMYLDPYALERFELLVARQLAEFGARRGRTFKFMRRAIRMPLSDLAALLTIYPGTIRQWEDEEIDVDEAAFTVLRGLVLAHLQSEPVPQSSPTIHTIVS